MAISERHNPRNLAGLQWIYMGRSFNGLFSPQRWQLNVTGSLNELLLLTLFRRFASPKSSPLGSPLKAKHRGLVSNSNQKVCLHYEFCPKWILQTSSNPELELEVNPGCPIVIRCSTLETCMNWSVGSGKSIWCQGKKLSPFVVLKPKIERK